MVDITSNPDAPSTKGMDRKIKRSWWRSRAALISISAIMVIIAGVFIVLAMPAPGTMTAPADAQDSGQVMTGPFQDYVPLRAQVVPLDITYITAVSGGQVSVVAAQDGDMVTAGQELARLENPDLTLNVASREADVSGRLGDTNSQLMALRTDEANRDQAMADAVYALHKAQEDLQKHQYLRERGVDNDANVKPFADEVAYHSARVAALKMAQGSDADFFARQKAQIVASADDLRRSLAEVRQGLDALTIRAPLAGRLTGFDLKPGQAVKPGDSLGEVDTDKAWKLSADVDEYYLARLSPGLKATASLHGADTPVHITKVYPQVHDGHVTVEMQFDSVMPADLKRGEAVDTRLSLGKTSQALLAPAGPWLNDSNGAYAFVLNAAGDRADRRAIATGRRNPDYVEVLSGLKPGERILTGGLADYSGARHIRFSKSKTS